MDIMPAPKKPAARRKQPNATQRPKPVPVVVAVGPEQEVQIGEQQVTPSALRRMWLKRIALGLLGILIVFAAILIGWYNVAISPVDGHNTSHKRVTVESGMNVSGIAHLLKSAGLIRDETAFRLYADFTHSKDKLQAGTYLFSPSQSVASIISDLTSGKTDAVNVTILPGKRLDQIKTILEHAGFSAKNIDDAFAANYQYAALFASKPSGSSLEGYIYPETYQIDSTSSPASFVARTLDLFEQKVVGQGIAAKLQAEGLSLYQGITLASIVEQEAKPADRAQVAQVFLLRIKDGMQLGSDVTAIYGAIHDGLKLPSDPAAAASIAIAHDSPYNTRLHSGLPPGPIANFDINVLEAVANPAPGDYLYFVVGDDGKTYFARTEAEHEQNVQNYCHKLCS